MKLEVRISCAGSQKPKTRSVELVREAGRLLLTLDGRPVEADAVEVATGTYSILLSGQSFEVRVQPAADGVRVHTGDAELSARVLEAEGRQQITAPMPGKVVRLLVKLGDAVEAGQGLLVVEAMKMQNEIRAPKTGKIEGLLVAEGQAVNAGEVLAIVA